MTTIGNPGHPKQCVVLVEYDGPNGRRTRTFSGPSAAVQARRAYARLLRDGKNPSVKKPTP